MNEQTDSLLSYPQAQRSRAKASTQWKSSSPSQAQLTQALKAFAACWAVIMQPWRCFQLLPATTSSQNPDASKQPLRLTNGC